MWLQGAIVDPDLRCSHAQPASSFPPFLTALRSVAANVSALIWPGACARLKLSASEALMKLRTFCVVSFQAGATPGGVSAETACRWFDAWIDLTARVAACARASLPSVGGPVAALVVGSCRCVWKLATVERAAWRAASFWKVWVGYCAFVGRRLVC